MGGRATGEIFSNREASVASSNLALVCESLASTAMVHTSHFTPNSPPPPPPVHVPVRALLAGGGAPPSSSLRVLRGNIIFPAAEAERLNVAAASRLYCSPYLLITSDSLMSPLPTPLFLAKLS